MINKENRGQLDRIANILDCDFGIADCEGNVIYSGSCNIKENSVINIPDCPDTAKEYDFVSANGFKYLRHKIENDLSVWFFISSAGGDDSDCRLLELAVYAYDNKGEVRRHRMAEFFRGLMTGGISSVESTDFNMYTAEMRSDVVGYTVVMVSHYGSREDETDISLTEEFLKVIYPVQEGYYVVPLDSERICIVCPVTEENTFDALLETSNLIKDTALSELMMSVTVSVGVVVGSLRNIDSAYKTAERADAIGRIFEFEEKCFVYDRLGLARLVYGLPRETCMAFLKETFGAQFMEEKAWHLKSNGISDEIRKTIQTFLNTNQNISETSRVLYIHRNTLVYRLDKFNKMTGLDCTKFEDGMKVGMALLVLQYLSKLPGRQSGTQQNL